MNVLLLSVIQALSWMQIDFQQDLVLNRNVPVNASIQLAKGTKIHVDDILPLDEIAVLTYQMHVSPCSKVMKNQESDIEIVDDLYGIKLNKDCKLEVFVENGDLSKDSWFNEP